MVSQGQYYNPLPALYLFPRGDNFDEIRLYERYDTNYGFMKQYWPYGDGGLSLQNPYWTQNRIRRTSDKKRYMLNASLKWKVTDWLNITGRVNLDNSDYRNKNRKNTLQHLPLSALSMVVLKMLCVRNVLYIPI